MPVLTEVIVRKLSGAGQLNPTQAVPDEIADGRLDSKLVTLDGTVLGQSKLGVYMVLALQWVDRTLQVLLPARATGFDGTAGAFTGAGAAIERERDIDAASGTRRVMARRFTRV